MVISMLDITILCFMGLLSIFTQFCLFTALKYSNPSFLAPFEYIRIFFAVIIGILIFKEVPSLYTIIGSIIIISSTYLLTYLEK
jgi:drug/metabolite transporter (DMT)-like permease